MGRVYRLFDQKKRTFALEEKMSQILVGDVRKSS